MRWVVLNPNTSQAMTAAVVNELRMRAPAGTLVQGLTARAGCEVIDSRETFLMGARAALDLLTELPADTDAVLLACFGDPGLEALRSFCSVPIVGLAEAALQRANATGEPFAIVTAGANWVGLLRERADSFGFGQCLNGVYALDGNGAALRKAPEQFREQVHALSVRAADAGARTLILGGAAFAGLDFAADAGLMLLDVYQIASDALKQAAAMRHNSLQDGLVGAAQPNEAGKSP